MSVVVRMEMPLNCLECPMYDWNRQKLCCNAHFDLRPIPNGGVPKPDWCPILCQLPEGHGWLVDADELKCIDEQPTVAASPWHRVEEELPEIGQIVLVYDEWRRLSICQLDNSYRWLRQDGGWFNGPCACYWMPIEPPKEEQWK